MPESSFHLPRFLRFRRSRVLSSNSSHHSKRQNLGMFHQSHDFSATGNFIDGNVGSVMHITNPSNEFMKEFLKETIPGAAFDSSARHPPPRCHPGTRLAVLKRCLYFVCNCSGVKKVRWVVGAAGVGKSAIMQNVAESPKLPVTSNASVFFSINGRNDGTKAITTLSYQLAAKSEAYRRVIEDEITRDPSLLQSSMPVQFEKFIVQPFIHNPDLNSAGRVLIIIDGLDECSNSHTQIELLRLISNFCISYPSSPIVWLIASRPEAHITSFFSRAEVMPAYEKEEILVDSDDARADVERFLRDALTEIKKASDSLDQKWPDEQDLWKLANASGGLFAYAHTVIRYIGDSTIGSAASQLSDILHVIDNHPLIDVPREEHPMALLDALYFRIMTNVSPRIMASTRQLLLALASNWDSALPGKGSFVELCNWLHMTVDEAYAAINQLRSVLLVPRREKAHEESLEPFHKSFIDYISDLSRSGFSSDIQREAQQLKVQCAFRVLKKAPDGIHFGQMGYEMNHGSLVCGPGTGDEILLTWLVDTKPFWNNNRTRLSLYKLAIGEVVYGMERGDQSFQSNFCIHLLTTKFASYKAPLFPYNQLRDLVYDESRRQEFIMHGTLGQIHLDAVEIFILIDEVKLQFRCSATTVTNLFLPWNPSCQHEREGEWQEGKDQNWVTSFWQDHDPPSRKLVNCDFCSDRLNVQLERLKIQKPRCTLPILFTSTGECCAELRFVDPRDGMSEWIYWFWLNLTPQERKKYGSSV